MAEEGKKSASARRKARGLHDFMLALTAEEHERLVRAAATEPLGRGARGGVSAFVVRAIGSAARERLAQALQGQPLSVPVPPVPQGQGVRHILVSLPAEDSATLRRAAAFSAGVRPSVSMRAFACAAVREAVRLRLEEVEQGVRAPSTPARVVDPRVERMRQLRDEGWSYRQIAREFGVSAETVRKKLQAQTTPDG